MFKTIEWTPEGVRMIDQTRLPSEEVYLTCHNYREVAEAMGIALGIIDSPALTVAVLRAEFETIAQVISQTRPTAVNLFWDVERMRKVFEEILAEEASDEEKIHKAKSHLAEEAQRILAEDIAANELMGRHGAALLEDSMTVLTHCNAGALATGGFGTALGVIRSAVQQGKKICVYADETRPFLQGARLTAWELARDGIPVTLITDSMAGHFLKQGEIKAVIVGADRIAANGDTANKIGTYSVAVLARENSVPFYVYVALLYVDRRLEIGDNMHNEESESR